MSARYFLDTNILVYSFMEDDPAKRDRARELVLSALEGRGMISFQVVQEFLNVALRKFSPPMTTNDAQNYINAVLTPLCRVQSEPDLYSEAIAVHVRWRFSFYDAIIIAAALRAGCDVLYSEDLQHGQQIAGLTILNPFR